MSSYCDTYLTRERTLVPRGKKLAITLLEFLIIHFSWVSFALSTILCANASSPAAKPPSPAGMWNAPNKWPFKSAHAIDYLVHYICTISALEFCCYYQHVLSQLLLKHHSSANKDSFCAFQPRVLKEESALKHLTTTSCKWPIQRLSEIFLQLPPSISSFSQNINWDSPFWRQH